MAAMQRPMIGHRSGAMESLLQGMAPRLQALSRTKRPVLVGSCSATGFMEMAVRNGVRRRALAIVNGSFSERFAVLSATARQGSGTARRAPCVRPWNPTWCATLCVARRWTR